MKFLDYFDIRLKHFNQPDTARPALRLGPRRGVWLQWLALFAGVLIQPYFEGFRQSHPHAWHFNGFLDWSLFALITSIVIFPAVYRRVVDSNSPAIIQFAPIFASGLGWESLMGTVIGAVTGH